MGQINLGVFDTGYYDIGGSGYAGLGIEAQIVGLGGMNKYGSSALLLQASNSFEGDMTVWEGIADARNDHPFGFGFLHLRDTAAGPGGSIILRNSNVGNTGLIVDGADSITPYTGGSLLVALGNCSWGDSIFLGTNLVVQADNLTISGPVSGPNGMEFLSGTTILGGSLSNSYTGTTLVHNQLLEFDKPYGLNASAGPIVVGGGAGGTCEARWLNGYQDPSATPFTTTAWSISTTTMRISEPSPSTAAPWKAAPAANSPYTSL